MKIPSTIRTKNEELRKAWEQLARIINYNLATTGEAGPEGPQGPAGSAGAQGPAGATGRGVPAGGASGQILTKASGWDYDDEWAFIDADQIQSGVIDPARIPPVTPTSTASVLVSGGAVVWVTDYQYRVSASSYLINGVAYTAPQTVVTLSPADPSDDRIDVVYVDIYGVVGVQTGVAGANPIKPDLDPAAQLELTFILVKAGTTAPATVTDTNIYQENAEWTASGSSGAYNVASTTDPFAGTYCVETTSAARNSYITFAGITTDLSVFDNLVFHLKMKVAMPSASSLTFRWYLGGVAVGVAVSLRNGVYGFNGSNITSYQQVVIPISSFTLAGSSVDTLRITIAGSASQSYRLDSVFLQAGAAASPTYNAGMTFRGAWAASTAYIAQDVATRTSGGVTRSFVCLHPVTSATPPETDTTNWSPLDTDAVAWGGITGTLSSQTDLNTALGGKVSTTRTISTTAPLTGGGDLSADRTLDVNNFGGDAGAGGTKGTVPAPAVGDAAAGKYLKADGTWTVPPTGGGVWGAITGTLSDQADLNTALGGKVATTRLISTTAPLTGGGDLSANRTLDISNFGGDAGAGGTKGTVPAPGAGDAAAGKFLKADGTWAVPSTGGVAWGAITGLLSDQTDLNTALAGKEPTLGFTAVPNTRTVNAHALSADVTVTKGDVGLGNCDNTSDAAKPVSTAQQAALDTLAQIMFPVWFPGAASSRTVVLYVGVTSVSVAIATNLTGCKAKVTTNPSAPVTYSIRKNNVEFGTLGVAADGTLTWTSVAGATIAADDVLSIVEPTDATLADVNITLKAIKS